MSVPIKHSLFSDLEIQSSDLIDGELNIVQHENVMFNDAGMSADISAPRVTFRPDSDVGNLMGDFLSRPVPISTFSWSEGSTTPVQLAFNPWSLYFNTPSVRNKLTNYARLRCNLKLKFVINASPFYYGALRVCYTPLVNNALDAYQSPGDQIKLSQLPGEFIYPGDMTSFEMELPFLWPNSWLRTSSIIDFTTMGRIQYILYSVLRSANGVTSTNVNVTCYAWAENVELAGLTSGLVLQVDEYEKAGPISGPASAVANIASKLSEVPVIGKLAMATQVGANAVAGVASLFGFSNPPVINDVMPYQPKSFHAFANCETSMPLDKLSVDPKAETTIDRTVTGTSSDDELVLTTFCGKQSFLSGTLWTDAYAPGTQLFIAPVTPMNVASNAGVSQTYINATPAAHAGSMFVYWRGSMIYTLRFVKSKYHTGRVKISWDPAVAPGDFAETTTLTRIVDLQSESEVEFVIPFKSYQPWVGTPVIFNNWANSTAGTVNSFNSNGVIKVTVLNELTGPAASQQIDLLLFVRAGPDIRFAKPNDLPDWSILEVQSDISSGSSDSIEASVPAVTIGESVVSLRTLLHRSSYWHTQFLGNQLTSNSSYYLQGPKTTVNYIPRFPVEYGFTTLAVNFATGILDPSRKQFQFSPNVPINWLANCFVGYRGSLVHHFNVVNNNMTNRVDEIRVERDYVPWILDAPRQAINRFTTLLGGFYSSGIPRLMMTFQFGVRRSGIGQKGMSLTNPQTQSALSVVTPQYSASKFRPAHIAIRSDHESMVLTAQGNMGMNVVNQDSGWPRVNIFVAGGADFDLIHFLCIPTRYSFVVPEADDTF